MGDGKDALLVRNLGDVFGSVLKHLMKENVDFTVGDLDRMSDAEIMRIPGIGKRGCQDVRSALYRLTGVPDYRPRWEYITVDLSLAIGMQNLNERGAEGWEAVATFGAEVLLKREVRN